MSTDTKQPRAVIPAVESVVRKLLDSSNDANLDYIARILGLPKMSEMPRPGDVRAWNFDEWKDWATKYGLEELPRTTHSYVLCHPHFKMLRVAMSSSTGDVKSRLNLGSDVRQAFRFEYGRLTHFAAAILDQFLETKEASEAQDAGVNENFVEELISKNLREFRHTPTYNASLKRSTVWSDSDDDKGEAGRATSKVSSVKRLLMKAADLTGQSPRTIVRKLVQLTAADYNNQPLDSPEFGDTVERVYKVIVDEIGLRHSSQMLFIDFLKDLIETHEAVEEEQKRAKLEAREAARLERQKASKQDAQTLVTDDPAAFAKSMADIRGSFLKLTGPLLTTMNEAMAKVREIAEHSASFPSPSYPTAKLAELGAANTALFERASSLEDQLDDMKTAKDAVDAELKRLRDEHAIAEQMLSEVATHSDWRGAYAELVTTLDAALASSDFLQLAVGVQTARQALSAAKAKIAKP